jgi:hypothetical protein
MSEEPAEFEEEFPSEIVKQLKKINSNLENINETLKNIRE